jgi:hypothetical protein
MAGLVRDAEFEGLQQLVDALSQSSIAAALSIKPCIAFGRLCDIERGNE